MNTKPRTTRRRQMSITDADYARLQELGKGNASEGLRVALGYANANRMGEVPQPLDLTKMKTQEQPK